jgi:hypothetical protein
MNTGEALNVLIKAGYITKEEREELERKAALKAQKSKITAARCVAQRALVDYFAAIMPNEDRKAHERFVNVLFDELEKESDLSAEDPKPKKEVEDPLAKFLKEIGVA